MNTYSIEVKIPERERLEKISEQVLGKYIGERATSEKLERWRKELIDAFSEEITISFKPN